MYDVATRTSHSSAIAAAEPRDAPRQQTGEAHQELSVQRLEHWHGGAGAGQDARPRAARAASFAERAPVAPTRFIQRFAMAGAVGEVGSAASAARQHAAATFAQTSRSSTLRADPGTAQARTLAVQTAVPADVLQRRPLPSTVGGGWTSIRDAAYQWMIDGLRSLQRSGIARLRAMAARLSPIQAVIAYAIINEVEKVSDVLIRLLLAVVGMLVGFGTGVVQAVVGLFRLLVGVLKGLLLFLYGFFDHGEQFDAWANDVLRAIRAIPAGLAALIDQWLAEFEHASEDRQTIMIGELVGQILALIATFEVAAARAGAVPRLTAQLGTLEGPLLAVARGGGRAGTAASISIDIGSPTAAAVYTGTWAMSATAAIEDLYGQGPETRAIQQTTRRRGGLASRPRHHIFPQEYRDSFFRNRGFNDIDDFCVELEEAEHQALHGGGDWRLGRTWPGEWNARIMAELAESERYLGRALTRNEIITIGRELMAEYGIELDFVPYR